MSETSVKSDMEMETEKPFEDEEFECDACQDEGCEECEPESEEDEGDEIVSTHSKKSGPGRRASFYINAKEGDVYHIRHGGEQFVRAVVVVTDAATGRKALKAVGLVGNWGDALLAMSRRVDGKLLAAQGILSVVNQETTEVHPTYIYESEHCTYKKSMDPRNMAPLAFEVPPMTPEQKKMQEEIRFLRAIKRAMDRSKSPAEQLQDILKLAQEGVALSTALSQQ